MMEQKILDRYGVTDTLNKDFYSSSGVAHGKMRAVIFFFHCARASGEEFYEEIAGRLLDEVLEGLSVDTPLGFADGLCGIGWGMEYLIQQGFIEGNADEVLTEIDAKVMYAISLQDIDDLGLDNGVLSLGYYIMMRIRFSWEMGDTYSSLELKENLIYLIDWLDCVLNNDEAVKDDVLDWLLELRRVGFYKTKVEKMIARINNDLYEEC